jgi:hypothetical protein
MKRDIIRKIIITPESLEDCDEIKCEKCRFAHPMNPEANKCFNKEKRKEWRFMRHEVNNFLNNL